MCLDNAMPVLEFNDTFMSDWNKIQYYIHDFFISTNAMPVLEFNDTFMSDWNKIQYYIHVFFISTNFNNFSKKSMMFHAIETDLNFNDL